jgi:predicted transcriptional regulator
MPELLTIKVDPRMKAALRKLAENQFISVSAVVKQAIHRHLQEHGVNWREEAKPKNRRK